MSNHTYKTNTLEGCKGSQAVRSATKASTLRSDIVVVLFVDGSFGVAVVAAPRAAMFTHIDVFGALSTPTDLQICVPMCYTPIQEPARTSRCKGVRWCFHRSVISLRFPAELLSLDGVAILASPPLLRP